MYSKILYLWVTYKPGNAREEPPQRELSEQNINRTEGEMGASWESDFTSYSRKNMQTPTHARVT